MFLLAVAFAAPFVPPGLDAVSAGQSHTCALAQGEVWCWGGSKKADVQAGTWSTRRVPQIVALPGPVRHVSAGGMGRTCAVTVDERVFCWGLGEPPVQVEGVRATQVDVGLAHACAVGPSGVACWGSNTHGQLGTGDTAPRDGAFRLPIEGAVQVSAGDAHSCARLASGQVWCWGSNAQGQLGNATSGAKGVAPGPAMWVQDAITVAAGGFHTCLVRADGGVLCAGDNLDGQLGDGTRTPSAIPVVPKGVSDVVQLDAGFGHTCAVRRDGAVICWGANDAGQLASSDTSDQLLPGFLRDVADAARVATGQQHTCVVRRGQVQCTGGNQASQLGDGTAEGRAALGSVLAP